MGLHDPQEDQKEIILRPGSLYDTRSFVVNLTYRIDLIDFHNPSITSVLLILLERWKNTPKEARHGNKINRVLHAWDLADEELLGWE